MAFLRIVCQRVKGPGYVEALQMILSRTPASPSVMPLLRASEFPVYSAFHSG